MRRNNPTAASEETSLVRHFHIVIDVGFGIGRVRVALRGKAFSNLQKWCQWMALKRGLPHWRLADFLSFHWVCNILDTRQTSKRQEKKCGDSNFFEPKLFSHFGRLVRPRSHHAVVSFLQ